MPSTLLVSDGGRAAATLLLTLLALGSISTSVSVADAKSRAERRIVEAVDERTAAGLKLLEQTVNVNSGTLNTAGVREVGRLFAPEFEKLGFRTRWVDGAAWGRAGHLVAERPGRKGSVHVLFIGHLDTVFESDSPFQRMERLSETSARGPGVADMKGGIVVMLLALNALSRADVLDRMSATVILTGDEEKPGRPLELSRRDLVEAARAADVAIGFEDGDGDPRTAVVARRGSSTWILQTKGKASHSSQIFREDVGSGAIYEAARILVGIQDTVRGEPLLTASAGVMVGGTTVSFEPEENRGTAFGKTNVVPETATVAGDLRAISLEQREQAKERIRTIVSASLPHTQSEISFDDSHPPLAPSEGNRRLLAMFDEASRDLGFGPVTQDDPARAGAADISFTEGLVTMALDGVGMMGEGGHTVSETADLRTLPMNAKRVAVMLSRLVSGWKRGK